MKSEWFYWFKKAQRVGIAPACLEIIRLEQEIKAIRNQHTDIVLTRPDDDKLDAAVIRKSIYEPNLSQTAEILTRSGHIETIEVTHHHLDGFRAANLIAGRYHLSYLSLHSQLQGLYPDDNIPQNHIMALCKQIDNVQNQFEIIETKIIEALAIIKTKDNTGNDMWIPLLTYNTTHPINKIFITDIQTSGVTMFEPAEADITIDRQGKIGKVR